MGDFDWSSFLEKARRYACAHGCSDLAEDFAQEAAIALLKRPPPPGVKPNLLWLFSDFMTQEYSAITNNKKIEAKRTTPKRRNLGVKKPPRYAERPLEDYHLEKQNQGKFRDPHYEIFESFLSVCGNERERVMIVLVFVYGMTSDEVARCFDINAATVTLTIQKVRKRILERDPRACHSTVVAKKSP